MNHLLKAMGFWVWGLIAIALSLSLAVASFRMLSILRVHGTSITSTLGASAEFDAPVEKHPPSLRQHIPTGPMISRIIGNEMTAAQKALQAGQWAEALKNLEAAQTKSGLTAFDLKTIHYFKAFADLKLNDLKLAQGELEKALATGAATAEEKLQYTRILFGIALSSLQFQTVIEYGKEMADAGSATPNDLAIIAQSYFQLKDCKSAGTWVDKAVAASRKAGEAPKENLFLFKLQCASDAGDNAAMIPVLFDLIRLNNKSTYWNTLLRIERQDERDDRNTLMLYRVMYGTNAMTVGSDYIEMAQLLGDAALPAEAQTVLEKAIASGLIGDAQKERTNRLLDSFKTRTDSDKKGLAQLDAEATKNPAGELDVKLGEVYYGTGDYQGAVTAISRGIQKGQIRHLDDAYLYLALARTALHEEAAADDAFGQLNSVPGISRRVVDLWRLFAETRQDRNP